MSAESQNRFQDLLLRYSQEFEPEKRATVEQKLWDDFGKTISPLVVDMSGFTRISRERGIVHYLSMVRRMQLTARPIIESYHGDVVKFEADNAFAHFANPGNAIRASIALNLAMESANLLTPQELDIEVSCGIDHGNCLMPHASDFFGVAVNRASKLGEDLGRPGQILVTPEAMQLVPESLEIETQIIHLEVGGEKTEVHSVVFKRQQD